MSEPLISADFGGTNCIGSNNAATDLGTNTTPIIGPNNAAADLGADATSYSGTNADPDAVANERTNDSDETSFNKPNRKSNGGANYGSCN